MSHSPGGEQLSSSTESDSITGEKPAMETAVTCGCFGKRRKSNRAKAKPTNRQRPTVLYKVDAGTVVQREQFEVFFDALESHDSLEEGASELDLYPIITTSEPPPTPPPPEEEKLVEEAGLDRTEVKQDRTEGKPAPKARRASLNNLLPARFPAIRRRMSQLHILKEPVVQVEERGFPGQLTPYELEQTHKFVELLKEKDKYFQNIVLILGDVEDHAYGICRWLRGNKFDLDTVFMKIERLKDAFIIAEAHGFYPNIEEVLGVPLGAFQQQFHMMCTGFAKNECPIRYWRAGMINSEAVLAMQTPETVKCFFWYQFLHEQTSQLALARKKNPHFVRMDSVTIFDMEGMSVSTAMAHDTKELMDILVKMGKYVPETTHCIIVLNAPGFFSMCWKIVKRMLHPRTAARIQVFSSRSKGIARLKEMVDISELPSEYDGTGPSFKDLMETMPGPVGTPKVDRKIQSELITLSRKGTTRVSFDVAEGKQITITIHTRSASSGKVTVVERRKDASSGEQIIFDGLVAGIMDADNGAYKPCRTELVKDLKGPATFEVAVEDLNDGARSSASRGYFLVVADRLPVGHVIHNTHGCSHG